MKPQVFCMEAVLLYWAIAGYVQGHLTATQNVLHRRSAADLIPFLHERDLYYRRSNPEAAQWRRRKGARRSIRTTGGRIRRRRSGGVGGWR